MAATTGTVTVNWNTQTLASLVLTTQASASQTHAASEPIWKNLNAGAGICQTTDASANLTVNFGNVTPDSVQYTDCQENNAVSAYTVDNDSLGYTVSEQVTAGNPANYDTAANGALVCILPDGVYANNLAYTASTRTSDALTPSIVSTTACPGGDFIAQTASAVNLVSPVAATAGTTLNSDMELVLGPNAASSGGVQVAMVVTYTLTSK
jgi:hypothetical protein